MQIVHLRFGDDVRKAALREDGKLPIPLSWGLDLDSVELDGSIGFIDDNLKCTRWAFQDLVVAGVIAHNKGSAINPIVVTGVPLAPVEGPKPVERTGSKRAGGAKGTTGKPQTSALGLRIENEAQQPSLPAPGASATTYTAWWRIFVDGNGESVTCSFCQDKLNPKCSSGVNYHLIKEHLCVPPKEASSKGALVRASTLTGFIERCAEYGLKHPVTAGATMETLLENLILSKTGQERQAVLDSLRGGLDAMAKAPEEWDAQDVTRIKQQLSQVSEKLLQPPQPQPQTQTHDQHQHQPPDADGFQELFAQFAGSPSSPLVVVSPGSSTGSLPSLWHSSNLATTPVMSFDPSTTPDADQPFRSESGHCSSADSAPGSHILVAFHLFSTPVNSCALLADDVQHVTQAGPPPLILRQVDRFYQVVRCKVPSEVVDTWHSGGPWITDCDVSAVLGAELCEARVTLQGRCMWRCRPSVLYAGGAVKAGRAPLAPDGTVDLRNVCWHSRTGMLCIATLATVEQEQELCFFSNYAYLVVVDTAELKSDIDRVAAALQGFAHRNAFLQALGQALETCLHASAISTVPAPLLTLLDHRVDALTHLVKLLAAAAPYGQHLLAALATCKANIEFTSRTHLRGPVEGQDMHTVPSTLDPLEALGEACTAVLGGGTGEAPASPASPPASECLTSTLPEKPGERRQRMRTTRVWAEAHCSPTGTIVTCVRDVQDVIDKLAQIIDKSSPAGVRLDTERWTRDLEAVKGAIEHIEANVVFFSESKAGKSDLISKLLGVCDLLLSSGGSAAGTMNVSRVFTRKTSGRDQEGGTFLARIYKATEELYRMVFPASLVDFHKDAHGLLLRGTLKPDVDAPPLMRKALSSLNKALQQDVSQSSCDWDKEFMEAKAATPQALHRRIDKLTTNVPAPRIWRVDISLPQHMVPRDCRSILPPGMLKMCEAPGCDNEPLNCYVASTLLSCGFTTLGVLVIRAAGAVNSATVQQNLGWLGRVVSSTPNLQLTIAITQMQESRDFDFNIMHRELNRMGMVICSQLAGCSVEAWQAQQMAYDSVDEGNVRMRKTRHATQGDAAAAATESMNASRLPFMLLVWEAYCAYIKESMLQTMFENGETDRMRPTAPADGAGAGGMGGDSTDDDEPVQCPFYVSTQHTHKRQDCQGRVAFLFMDTPRDPVKAPDPDAGSEECSSSDGDTDNQQGLSSRPATSAVPRFPPDLAGVADLHASIDRHALRKVAIAASGCFDTLATLMRNIFLGLGQLHDIRAEPNDEQRNTAEELMRMLARLMQEFVDQLSELVLETAQDIAVIVEQHTAQLTDSLKDEWRTNKSHVQQLVKAVQYYNGGTAAASCDIAELVTRTVQHRVTQRVEAMTRQAEVLAGRCFHKSKLRACVDKWSKLPTNVMFMNKTAHKQATEVTHVAGAVGVVLGGLLDKGRVTVTYGTILLSSLSETQVEHNAVQQLSQQAYKLARFLAACMHAEVKGLAGLVRFRRLARYSVQGGPPLAPSDKLAARLYKEELAMYVTSTTLNELEELPGIVRTRLQLVVDGLHTELVGDPMGRPCVAEAIYNYVSHLSFNYVAHNPEVDRALYPVALTMVQLAKRLGQAMADTQSTLDAAGLGELGPKKAVLLEVIQQVEEMEGMADTGAPVQTRSQKDALVQLLKSVQEAFANEDTLEAVGTLMRLAEQMALPYVTDDSC